MANLSITGWTHCKLHGQVYRCVLPRVSTCLETRKCHGIIQCQGNVRDFSDSWAAVREKILLWKVAKKISYKLCNLTFSFENFFLFVTLVCRAEYSGRHSLLSDKS